MFMHLKLLCFVLQLLSKELQVFEEHPLKLCVEGFKNNENKYCGAVILIEYFEVFSMHNKSNIIGKILLWN